MNQVVQENAANSEESASASEELSGQAVELHEMVRTLMGIVAGTSKNESVETAVPEPPGHKVKPLSRETTSSSTTNKPSTISNISVFAKTSTNGKTKTLKPDKALADVETLIPFDDDDDF